MHQREQGRVIWLASHIQLVEPGFNSRQNGSRFQISFSWRSGPLLPFDHYIVTQLPNGLLGSLWPRLWSVSREEPEITPRCTSKSCHSLPTAFLFLGQRRNSWLTSSYPASPPRPPCTSSLPPRSHASPSHTSPLKALPALLFSQEHTAVSLQSFHPSDLTASITPFRV